MIRIQIVLNTWENKKLLAKTIVEHPLVKEALNHTIAIGRGVTNAYILQELLKVTNSDLSVNIDNYVAGIIDGDLWLSDPETRTAEVVIRNGKAEFEPIAETMKKMGPNDLIIKGANVIGLDMVPGVLVAHPQGGTIGAVYSIAVSQGINILVPISIEKFVPIEVSTISNDLGGQKGIDKAQGLPVGIHPITYCDIFTEIDAFKLIANVDVFPIGAGGLYDGAGARVYEINGDKEDIETIELMLKEISEVKPLKTKLKSK